MTEYTTSSEAIREYMSARERTAQWVSSHSRSGTTTVFVSPSSPPSTISDPDAPSYGPSDSDEESSHSLPPRMVLRYNDGRPDVPISKDQSVRNGPLSHSGSRMDVPPLAGAPPQHYVQSHTRSRSGPQMQGMTNGESYATHRSAQSLSYASRQSATPHAPVTPPRSPESIVVLPSLQEESTPQSATHTARNPSHHSNQGSHTHSRSPSLQAAYGGGLPPPVPSAHSAVSQQHSQFNGGSHVPSHQRSQPHSIISPSPIRAFDPSQIPIPSGSPMITHSQSQPLPQPMGEPMAPFNPHSRNPSSRVQSQLPYNYSPPAIVYAPSSKHSRSRYTPPAIVYSPSATRHPQSRHAPSITYSHSAPLPQSAHGSHSGPSAYHSAHGSMSRGPSSMIPEEPTGATFDRGYERSRSRSRPGSSARGRTPARDVVYVDHPASPPSRSVSPESLSEDDHGSRTSGSTYYVLPTPGQKVKLIVPNSASVYTATSTTKSAHSPQSAHSGPKKPFFQRMFHIPKLSGSSSSSDGRGFGGSGKRLHRRHTIGGAHLQGRPGIPQR